jgi:hypothetical protein
MIEPRLSTGRSVMAEKIEVDVTGRSKHEIAHLMAIQILTVLEKKKLEQVTRQEYLTAHADAVNALSGARF